MQTLHYKTKQFFFVLIKISLVVTAFYSIYFKLAKNNHLEFHNFVQILTKNDAFSLKTIIFLVLLSVFNWFFEIFKWQILISSIKKINFQQALKQCLGALTVSIFTPNRIGEYGAKAIYFTNNFRKRVVLINVLNNFLQMGVTTIFGMIGLFLFRPIHSTLNIKYSLFYLFIFLLLVVLIIMVLKKISLKIKGFSFRKLKHFILHFSRKKLILVTVFSFGRFLIFSFQFYYLLTIFDIDLSYLNAMKIITSMYLLASIIPSIFLFDVVIKGSVAVYLFSLIGVNELIVLSIVTIMWILNFVLPSIAGSYYVLQFNFPKDNN